MIDIVVAAMQKHIVMSESELKTDTIAARKFLMQ